MKEISIGSSKEQVYERSDYPADKIRAILGQETIAVLGYGVQGRGQSLNMRDNGLKIVGGRGETHIVPTQATDNPAAIGPVDFVMFCVKLWDVESAGAAIKPLVGPNTAVIPFQNGIDAHERLAPILGPDHVMGGVAQISATIAEPGASRAARPIKSTAREPLPVSIADTPSANNASAFLGSRCKMPRSTRSAAACWPDDSSDHACPTASDRGNSSMPGMLGRAMRWVCRRLPRPSSEIGA